MPSSAAACTTVGKIRRRERAAGASMPCRGVPLRSTKHDSRYPIGRTTTLLPLPPLPAAVAALPSLTPWCWCYLVLVVLPTSPPPRSRRAACSAAAAGGGAAPPSYALPVPRRVASAPWRPALRGAGARSRSGSAPVEPRPHAQQEQAATAATAAGAARVSSYQILPMILSLRDDEPPSRRRRRQENLFLSSTDVFPSKTCEALIAASNPFNSILQSIRKATRMARAKLLEVQELQSECESELRTIEEGTEDQRQDRRPRGRHTAHARRPPELEFRVRRAHPLAKPTNRLPRRATGRDRDLPGRTSRVSFASAFRPIAALVERVSTAESAVEMHAPLEIVEASSAPRRPRRRRSRRARG